MTVLSTQKMSLLVEEFLKSAFYSTRGSQQRRLSARKFAKCLREQMFFHTSYSKDLLQAKSKEDIFPAVGARRLVKQRLMRHLSGFAALANALPSLCMHGAALHSNFISSELAYLGFNLRRCVSRREFSA
jgi:hypothetical protein